MKTRPNGKIQLNLLVDPQAKADLDALAAKLHVRPHVALQIALAAAVRRPAANAEACPELRTLIEQFMDRL
jgi:predicted transcriptional regulator